MGKLHFGARSLAHAAFLRELRRYGDRVHLYFYDEDRGPQDTSGKLDLASVIAEAPAAAHFYCCGPGGMIKAFEAAASGRPASNRHVERFAGDGEIDKTGSFDVVLSRSGERLLVKDEQTILQALLERGVFVDHSCEEGVCGSCQVGVVDGIPDHRDCVLTKDERARNDRIIVCCSRSKSPSLVLDL